jgi:hypothetical protein
MPIPGFLEGQQVRPPKPLNLNVSGSGSVSGSGGSGTATLITEADWKRCLTVVGNGAIEAALADGKIYFRGELAGAALKVATAGMYTRIGNLPDGFRPAETVQAPVYGILTGTSYRVALFRVSQDGTLSIAAPNGTIDGFSVNGLIIPAGAGALRGVAQENLADIAALPPGEKAPADPAILQAVEEALMDTAGVSDTGVVDTAWVACTMAAGQTGTLWARVWKGNVLFKSGTATGANFLTGPISDTTAAVKIATLPDAIPKPPARFHVPISTYQTASKSAYGTGLFFVNNTTGSIEVLPTTCPMDGFWPQGLSYPVGAWT